MPEYAQQPVNRRIEPQVRKMNTLTISLIVEPGDGTTAEKIDKLIECWRDDMAFIGARVTNTHVTGPWVGGDNA